MLDEVPAIIRTYAITRIELMYTWEQRAFTGEQFDTFHRATQVGTTHSRLTYSEDGNLMYTVKFKNSDTVCQSLPMTASPIRQPGQVGRSRLRVPVNRHTLKPHIDRAKEAATFAAALAVKNLENRFPDRALAKATSISQPKSWRDFPAGQNKPQEFTEHLKVLAAQFGVQLHCENGVAPPLLDSDQLKLQAEFFSRYMFEPVSAESDLTLSQVWTKMNAEEVFRDRCSEWVKLVRISLVLVSVSVEDERLFSALNYICNKLRQSLSSHLEASVRVKVQNTFELADFPFDLALEVLSAQEKERYAAEQSSCLLYTSPSPRD